MAKTTLIHPIALPALRGMFIHSGITASRITQVRYDPMQLLAEYDAVIVRIEESTPVPDKWTPKEVFHVVANALAGCSQCDYVIWRRDHWIAHISTWIPVEKTPSEQYLENPPEGSDLWIKRQEGIE